MTRFSARFGSFFVLFNILYNFYITEFQPNSPKIVFTNRIDYKLSILKSRKGFENYLNMCRFDNNDNLFFILSRMLVSFSAQIGPFA